MLSSKYFSSGDIFHPKKVDKPSYAWSSICKTVNTLGDGFGWQIDDGKGVDIKEDRWGFEGLINPPNDRKYYVRDLWVENDCRWDREKILEMYGEYWCERTCEIPLLSNGPTDRISWFHANNDAYSTKSGYNWLILKKVGFGPRRRIPPKARVFAWRVGHELLPTKNKIATIVQSRGSSCSRCGRDDETLIHALRDCSKARAVLMHGGIDNRLLNMDCQSGIDWLEGAMRMMDCRAFDCMVMLLWNVWNSRNN